MAVLDDLAVKNFREYLQIPSVHPNVDYSECVNFLKKLAEDIGLSLQVIYVKPNKPIIIITWRGEKPALPTVLLNSHMDVVPVFEEHWKHKPFGAEIDNGNIYARGAQDMKCNGIQYLEAIRRLKLKGVVCSRTVHVCFVPDEEIGGKEGMKMLVKSREFAELNVGVSLDESYASRTNKFVVFNAERICWQFTIHCRGESSDSSLLSGNTAGEKITYILNKFYDYRESQKKLLDSPAINLGNVTTINCTKIDGDCKNECGPHEMTITFDCRLSVSQCLKEFEEMIEKWCEEAGPNCHIKFHQKEGKVIDTRLDASNIFWGAFRETMDEMGCEYEVEVCIGTTDSRYLREVGVQAFGFTPINNTPTLLHGHDEFLGINTFLKGIDIYCNMIIKLANVEK